MPDFDIDDENPQPQKAINKPSRITGTRNSPRVKNTISFILGVAAITLVFLYLVENIKATKQSPTRFYHHTNLTLEDYNHFPQIPEWKLDTNKEYTLSKDDWDSNAEATIREYDFVISDILASPDGVLRNMTVINGKFPGPLVECNSGDTLKINVFNNGSTPTTIHFHGLFFNGTNFMDGANNINQCEIPSNRSFTYEFKISEEQYGTYWYHSHYSTQAADGVLGPVVIHSKEEEKLIGNLYDHDVVILAGDHYHDVAANYLRDYLASNNENDEPTPDNGLIQGSNIFKMPKDYYRNTEVINDHSTHHVFKFKPDSRYRLRVINVGFFADLDFSIDHHPLTIIEADGTLVKPLDVEVLNIAVAQRYSVIINTNATSYNNMFWMHARLNSYCFGHENSWLNTDVKAMVMYSEKHHYNLALDTLPFKPNSTEYSAWQNPECKELDETLLHPLIPTPIPENYTHHFRLDASFMIGGYQLDRGYFNSTSYKPLKSSSLYKQITNVTDSDPQWSTTGSILPWDDQMIININEPAAVVDLLINNLDDGSHPFHLHGYKFWILRASSGNFKFKYYDEIDASNEYMKRDTVNIPGYGWALLRIVADNPGIWPLHCHIGWHMEAGLTMQLSVQRQVYRDWEYPKEWLEMCDLSEQSN